MGLELSYNWELLREFSQVQTSVQMTESGNNKKCSSKEFGSSPSTFWCWRSNCKCSFVCVSWLSCVRSSCCTWYPGWFYNLFPNKYRRNLMSSLLSLQQLRNSCPMFPPKIWGWSMILLRQKAISSILQELLFFSLFSSWWIILLVLLMLSESAFS